LRAKEHSVSQHLKSLRVGGLIRGEKQGRSVVYRIDPGAPRTLRRITAGLPGARAREALRLSARNRLAGEVVAIERDAVASSVTLDVGGQKVQAVITTQALDELGLEVGDSAFAVVKATEVMLMR
ncbi:MAG: TOBE domain-containing protein, partial [Acidimicrobiia bacterium]